MANVGIEKEQVFKAAEDLMAIGSEPTIKAIREKLGNTGSLTTISKYREEWIKLKESQAPVAQIPDSFTAAAQGLWATAFRESEKIFQSQKDAVMLEKQKWEEEKKVYSLELEKLEVDKTSKEKRINDLEQLLTNEEKTKQAILDNNNKLSEQHAKLQGEVDALKDRLTSESERNKRLEDQLIALVKTKI